MRREKFSQFLDIAKDLNARKYGIFHSNHSQMDRPNLNLS
jgi:hypothetical protein